MLSKATPATCIIHCGCTQETARQAAYPGWGPPVTCCKRSASARCRAAAGGQPGVLLTPYELVEARDTYSIRLYAPHIVARTRYERRDEGFLRLGSYFDENKLQQAQPIVMRYPLQARSCCCSRAVGVACMPQPCPLANLSARPQGHKTMELYVGDAEVRIAFSTPVLAAGTCATERYADCDFLPSCRSRSQATRRCGWMSPAGGSLQCSGSPEAQHRLRARRHGNDLHTHLQEVWCLHC